MNPYIVEKNGKIVYTNYRGVRVVGVILFAAGSVLACVGILAFLGVIEPAGSGSVEDPGWYKGNVLMLIWILFFAGMAISTAMYYFWRGKTFHVTLGPENLQCKLSDKLHDIEYRDIDEVLWSQHDGEVRIRRGGKLLLVIPDWFFSSQGKEFVEFLKA